MSSNEEAVVSTAIALAIGIVVALSFSAAWGLGVTFAVYVVVMLNYILDRLDKLKRNDKENFEQIRTLPEK